MKLSETEFNKKFMQSIIQIRHQMDVDKMIYGDAYIEFSDRKIEVIQPDKVFLKVEMNPDDKIDKQIVKGVIDSWLKIHYDKPQKVSILKTIKRELGVE